MSFRYFEAASRAVQNKPKKGRRDEPNTGSQKYSQNAGPVSLCFLVLEPT
jgi:hypothetical protein